MFKIHILIFPFIFFTSFAFSQSPSPLNSFFFDARSTAFSRDGSKQEFNGDVVAIGAGVILLADTISYNKAQGSIEGNGQVILLIGNQVITGNKINYLISSGDFLIEEAVLSTSNGIISEKIKTKILGFSHQEIEFEAERSKRLQEINQRKKEMRIQYRNLKNKISKEEDEKFFQQYATLLDQEKNTSAQPNAILKSLPKDRQDSLTKRRDFWNSSRNQTNLQGQFKDQFFKIAGHKIERTNGNDYRAWEASWTSCRCDEGEEPAWGIRSSKIDAQFEGYGNLQDAVITIQGIPIFYIPYLKIPIKEKRQSGFLLPSLSWNADSGNIFSQPIYFANSPHTDSTLYVDYYEKRGTRIGGELRHRQKEYSGWEIKAEGLRDRLWLKKRNDREELLNLYSLGLDTARDNATNPDYRPNTESKTGILGTLNYLENPSFWNDNNMSACLSDNIEERIRCEANFKSQLLVPENTWRGMLKWRGGSYLAPRLSFASSGIVTTDHRYISELYIPEDIKEPFSSGKYVNAYNPAKGQLHLDNESFYAGVSSKLGDYARTQSRYMGQQLPFNFDLSTRMIHLTPERIYPFAIYSRLDGQYIRFSHFEGKGKDPFLFYQTGKFSDGKDSLPYPNLGPGSWQRGHGVLISPLVTQSFFQLHAMADYDARSIYHPGIPNHERSQIHSTRGALKFYLPLDGLMNLNDPLSFRLNSIEDQNTEQKFFRHNMDWSMTFSSRPWVKRTGPYGNTEMYGCPAPTYFSSDRGCYQDNDDSVSEEDLMLEHQRIIFATNHRFGLFKREKVLLEGALGSSSNEDENNSSYEKAKRELKFSLENPVVSGQGFFANGNWLVGRYTILNKDEQTFLTLYGDTSYDWIKDKKMRDKEKAQQKIEDIDRPWADPNLSASLSLYNFTVGGKTRYNPYRNYSKTASIGITFPVIFNFSLSLGHTIEKTFLEPEPGIFSFKRTTERTASLSTTIIPNAAISAHLKRQSMEGREKDLYGTSYGFVYTSNSNCWGLSFQREKDYNKEEKQASYNLQLQVYFVGQRRSFGDLSTPITRRLPLERES